ncbi:hypothetical protein SAY87_031986 [Trapa incisa]|uniref:Uncharacterized protein n=1 Tax=Trapa incisa TaxID=236973 RepID=A0AAN7QLL6_9MYRT|nr:hypothetical protein SAY87_031986 [Trapa incisa]
MDCSLVKNLVGTSHTRSKAHQFLSRPVKQSLRLIELNHRWMDRYRANLLATSTAQIQNAYVVSLSDSYYCIAIMAGMDKHDNCELNEDPKCILTSIQDMIQK